MTNLTRLEIKNRVSSMANNILNEPKVSKQYKVNAVASFLNEEAADRNTLDGFVHLIISRGTTMSGPVDIQRKTMAIYNMSKIVINQLHNAINTANHINFKEDEAKLDEYCCGYDDVLIIGKYLLNRVESNSLPFDHDTKGALDQIKLQFENFIAHRDDYSQGLYSAYKLFAGSKLTTSATKITVNLNAKIRNCASTIKECRKANIKQTRSPTIIAQEFLDKYKNVITSGNKKVVLLAINHLRGDNKLSLFNTINHGNLNENQIKLLKYLVTGDVANLSSINSQHRAELNRLRVDLVNICNNFKPPRFGKSTHQSEELMTLALKESSWVFVDENEDTTKHYVVDDRHQLNLSNQTERDQVEYQAKQNQFTEKQINLPGLNATVENGWHDVNNRSMEKQNHVVTSHQLDLSNQTERDQVKVTVIEPPDKQNQFTEKQINLPGFKVTVENGWHEIRSKSTDKQNPAVANPLLNLSNQNQIESGQQAKTTVIEPPVDASIKLNRFADTQIHIPGFNKVAVGNGLHDIDNKSMDKQNPVVANSSSDDLVITLPEESGYNPDKLVDNKQMHGQEKMVNNSKFLIEAVKDNKAQIAAQQGPKLIQTLVSLPVDKKSEINQKHVKRGKVLTVNSNVVTYQNKNLTKERVATGWQYAISYGKEKLIFGNKPNKRDKIQAGKGGNGVVYKYYDSVTRKPANVISKNNLGQISSIKKEPRIQDFVNNLTAKIAIQAEKYGVNVLLNFWISTCSDGKSEKFIAPTYPLLRDLIPQDLVNSETRYQSMKLTLMLQSIGLPCIDNGFHNMMILKNHHGKDDFVKIDVDYDFDVFANFEREGPNISIISAIRHIELGNPLEAPMAIINVNNKDKKINYYTSLLCSGTNNGARVDSKLVYLYLAAQGICGSFLGFLPRAVVDQYISDKGGLFTIKDERFRDVLTRELEKCKIDVTPSFKNSFVNFIMAWKSSNPDSPKNIQAIKHFMSVLAANHEHVKTNILESRAAQIANTLV